MREIETDTLTKKPEKNRTLSKRTLYIIYASIAGLFLFSLLIKNEALLWLFLTAFCMVANYHIDMMTIRVNVAPHLFSSLLITRTMGLSHAIVMLLFSTLFIHLYTARLDKDTLLGFILYILANIAMNFFPSANFVILGLVITSLKFLIGLGINLLIDIEPEELFFEHILGLLSNLLLFLIVGNVAEKLF